MSTPFDPEESPRRAPLEPTHVLRKRQPGSLADLLRQVKEREREPEEGYEVVAVPPPEASAPPRAPEAPARSPAPAAPAQPPAAKRDSQSGAVTDHSQSWAATDDPQSWVTEDDTQELPPVSAAVVVAHGESGPEVRERPAKKGPAHGRSTFLRSTALGVAATVAALGGFSGALLLTWDNDEEAAQARPPAASSAPPASAPARDGAGPQGADPDGPGTLREGDSGPEVSDLQERLLRIPDVYAQGTPTGVYDAALTAAVARFQLWYGIRGDETGVYGNDTRNDLESRTSTS
ncbi:peptidoglycan-binding domain-containing protein [Streptomyces kroppenstedtii]|uniref:peptidoglycan-binding domain-containing protein n=1 Tax=Streptomyces kroppenstedtii TaxID=3051181 RepID=UPI0028D596A4|nr:peptidoglycan-binding domain-containing protein [Streptomyces sp. DSM 40484]